MLRSSCSTYANRQLGRETYQRVAAFMCHDANTAKRFYQAEDPAEVTLRSRALTTRAISTYAAKKEEEQESSEPDEPVRRRLYQQHRKKMVRTAEEEGAGDVKTALDQTAENSEEEDDTMAQITYQLRRKILPPNQQKKVEGCLDHFMSFQSCQMFFLSFPFSINRRQCPSKRMMGWTIMGLSAPSCKEENTWRAHLERMGQVTGNPRRMTQMAIQKSLRKKLHEGFPTCLRKRE
nr:uncharacterized protein LOC124055984 [Scatophagus argus]